MDKPLEKAEALAQLCEVIKSCQRNVMSVAEIYGLIFDDESTQPSGTNRAYDALEHMAKALLADSEAQVRKHDARGK